mgnify:FL=1
MDIIPQLVANSVIAGAIYMLLAIGFNLLFSTVKFFDLGFGSMTAVGAYGAFYFGKTLGLNTFLGVIIGVLIAGAVGFLVGRFIYGPLKARKASSMVMLVASLGVLTALQAIIAILFTSQFQTLSQNVGSQRVYDIFGGVITEIQLIILAVGILTMIALALVLKFTMFGKAIKAIGDDEEVAKIVGINTERITG